MLLADKDMRRVYAIQAKYKQQILKVNPDINDLSGIYFLTRTDENGIRYFYIGQSVNILSRMISHMMGYQHIDLSLRKRGFYSSDNFYGWKLGFLNYPIDKLDEMEQMWILEYMKSGYQTYNKTSGGQGTGKEKISEYRPSKGYRDGIRQGYKNAVREISNIINRHCNLELKKPNNKVSQKQFLKLMDILNTKDGERDSGEQ